MTGADLVRECLAEEGYIFVTLFDGAGGKQVEKHVHPQSGAVVLVEHMHGGGIEVYENTPGNGLTTTLERIRARARKGGA